MKCKVFFSLLFEFIYKGGFLCYFFIVLSINEFYFILMVVFFKVRKVFLISYLVFLGILVFFNL